MDIFIGVSIVILTGLFFLSIGFSIAFLFTRVVTWWELNISTNYEENRAEKDVRQLKKKLNLIRLIKEKEELEERLSNERK